MENIIIDLQRDDGDDGLEEGVLQDSVLALVHKLVAHGPVAEAAEGEKVLNLRLLVHHREQVHLHAQRLHDVHHKVVDNIRLVALTDTVQVDGGAGKEQGQPLEGRRFVFILFYLSIMTRAVCC